MRRQSRSSWNDPHEREIIELIEAIADLDGRIYELGESQK